MHTIKQWVVAGVVAGAACVGASGAEAMPQIVAPQITAARVFRVPPSDALGAVVGGIIAVNGAAWIRRKREQSGAKR